ncbi:hypothetical protein CYMTET_40310 [Cymbomonas tetramitiformis]|uniref:Uncharacterized protein n=1 Tax=Cymbomonas tetramitiformis TaxID=36881 RepID=A0AAE0C9D1_9CHLO|nr:hypothetical protein CYMTET_40310 [Cymbomonas tetramitiformis]
MFSWGLTWGGAPLVYWFHSLEKTFPGTKARTVATKIAINCTIQAPVTNALFLGWCIYWSSPSFPHIQGLLENWREKLKLDMVSTTLRSWSVWVPVHTINFFFVPPHLRVLCVSTCVRLATRVRFKDDAMVLITSRNFVKYVSNRHILSRFG